MTMKLLASVLVLFSMQALAHDKVVCGPDQVQRYEGFLDAGRVSPEARAGLMQKEKECVAISCGQNYYQQFSQRHGYNRQNDPALTEKRNQIMLQGHVSLTQCRLDLCNMESQAGLAWATEARCSNMQREIDRASGRQ